MNRTSAVMLMVVALAAVAQLAEAGCAAGDNCCWCRAAGGTCKNPPKPLLPTCTITVQHQGGARKVNVFLPPNYSPSRAYPMWVQLHGNFWASMGGISGQVGYNPDAVDVTPLWDKTAGTGLNSDIIIVYPQSSGYSTNKQFWNTIFWRCSNGVCMDAGVNDVGFLDNVLLTVPGRFRAGQVYMSGTSAGGMMVYTMLCKSRVMQSRVRAAAVVMGGMGRDFAAGNCPNPARIPLLIMHGSSDQHIPFNRPVNLDYVDFMSTASTADFWWARNGLSRSRASVSSSAQMKCTTRSTGAATRSSTSRQVQLCEVWNTGHSTDQPWPGYMFGVARSFFARNP